jgi:hypothetical protein
MDLRECVQRNIDLLAPVQSIGFPPRRFREQNSSGRRIGRVIAVSKVTFWIIWRCRRTTRATDSAAKRSNWPTPIAKAIADCSASTDAAWHAPALKLACWSSPKTCYASIASKKNAEPTLKCKLKSCTTSAGRGSG